MERIEDEGAKYIMRAVREEVATAHHPDLANLEQFLTGHFPH